MNENDQQNNSIRKTFFGFSKARIFKFMSSCDNVMRSEYVNNLNEVSQPI